MAKQSESGQKSYTGLLAIISIAVLIGAYILMNSIFGDDGTRSIDGDSSSSSQSESSATASGEFVLDSEASVTGSVEEMLLRALGSFVELRNNGSYEYEVYENGVVITVCYLTDEEIIVPSTLDGLPVVCIGEFGVEEDVMLDYVTRRTGFAGNTTTKKVALPNSVLVTGRCCFADMSALTELDLPSTLQFYLCSANGTPWFAALSDEFCIVGDGILIKYTGTSETVAVPEGVRVIAPHALSSSIYYATSDITSLTLPESLEYICEDAITMAYGTTALTVPQSVTYIGDRGIDLSAAASELTELNIGDNVRYASQNSFCFDWTWPYFMNDEYTVIGDGVLIRWTGISPEPAIPEYVRVIACDMSAATSVSIPQTVEYIGTKCFPSLGSVYFAEGLKIIGTKAFYGSSLSVVKLPESLEYIGFAAFCSNNTLTDVIIPSALRIDSLAFADCPQLSAISLPEGLTYLGKRSLRYSNIGDITIPASVVLVDDEAFYGCSAAQDITVLGVNTTLGQNLLYGSYDGVICCAKGSRAHEAALAYGLPYYAD